MKGRKNTRTWLLGFIAIAKPLASDEQKKILEPIERFLNETDISEFQQTLDFCSDLGTIKKSLDEKEIQLRNKETYLNLKLKTLEKKAAELNGNIEISK